MQFRIHEKLPVTRVSAVGLVSTLCLNLTIQTLVGSFPGVIVPIPPHTQNIIRYLKISFTGE